MPSEVCTLSPVGGGFHTRGTAQQAGSLTAWESFCSAIRTSRRLPGSICSRIPS
jgi:hypothetical protein